MTKIGFRQFGLVWLLMVTLAGGAARADWTYSYADDFSANNAEVESCIHSLFWLDRATPPPEPYLYYSETGNRKLVFIGYQNQLAELGYCFPITSVRTQRAVKGTLGIDVSFPDNQSISQIPPGQLLYSVSGDGVAWSTPQSLSADHYELPIASLSGTAYIRFSGTRAAIDNLSVSLYSPPATINVPRDFDTIQAAIDAAGDGDIIEVAPALNAYSGPGNRDIQFRGKAITLRSVSGPQNTIIDCDPGHRGFHFRGAEGADSVLSGFTISGGQISGANTMGGGIYCEFSSPTIANCIIQDCSADVGGGIGGLGVAPVITDCTVTGCSATRGGGIGFVQQSAATITNCDISGNTASSSGGGLYCLNSVALIGGCRISGNVVPANMHGGGAYCAGTLTGVTFKNCVISANTAGAGAGIYTESTLGLQRCGVTVVNCTIARNRLTGTVPYPRPGSAIHSAGTDILVNSTIIWDNGVGPLVINNSPLWTSPVSYSDIEGGYEGDGNFNQDPLFADAAADDYHLKSTYGRYNPQTGGWAYDDDRNSPCIDAGDCSMSAADEPSPNGRRVNMGAYGATQEASKSAEHFVYHVAKTGYDWNGGRSREQAFRTIERALKTAQSGDTILVWPGVYQEELTFQGKAVTLQSAADAAILEAKNDFAVSFYHAEGPDSILANFVIRNCQEGAIFCSGASPTLRNLTIVNNGFGIAAYEGAEPYIVNCILWYNGGNLQGCKTYFSDVEGIDADRWAGNISSKPLFADPLNPDPAKRDFHLQSAYGRYVPESDTWVTDIATSPCVDVGNPEDYYEAELEPNGDRINMGAYGGTLYASKGRDY